MWRKIHGLDRDSRNMCPRFDPDLDADQHYSSYTIQYLRIRVQCRVEVQLSPEEEGNTSALCPSPLSCPSKRNQQWLRGSRVMCNSARGYAQHDQHDQHEQHDREVSSQCESSARQPASPAVPPKQPTPVDLSCKVSPFKPKRSARRALPFPHIQHAFIHPHSQHDTPITSPTTSKPADKLAPSHSPPNSHSHPQPPPSSLAHVRVPSPPPLSSSDDDRHSLDAPNHPKPHIDTSSPPDCSQDSVFFSFSKSKPRSPTPPPQPVQPLPQPSVQQSDHSQPDQSPQPPTPRTPYYSRAFEYVLEQVLNRYAFVLPQEHLDIASSLRDNLPENAYHLFVRLYARKQPQWFRLSHLERSYSPQIDVPSAIHHLCQQNLIISSIYAIRASPKSASLLARELLSTLDLAELRTVCSSIVDGPQIRRLPKPRLVLALSKLLSNSTPANRRKKKFTQTTLSGLSPAHCLARSVLKISGHSVRIPEPILSALRRIRFLFFLEDGHNSPNVILADIGRISFPAYTCQPNRPIFPSLHALEEYEAALELEQLIDDAITVKDWSLAAYYGSIAELEVREYLEICSTQNEELGLNHNSFLFDKTRSNSIERHVSSRRPPVQKRSRRKELLDQLCHPFLRRYTAQWVFVRSCWHSVYALERLSEYQNAVKRLKLLLSTDLMPRRRGKCLTRLTIDLFRHLDKLHEPLKIIVSELSSSTSPLHLGDQIALAQRGVAIHSKLTSAKYSRQNQDSLASETVSGHSALGQIDQNLPSVIDEVLKRASTKVPVRKILGKSLNVQNKEEKQRISNIEDSWQRYVERSKKALRTETDFPISGKSVFMSHQSKGRHVSVEEYCIEWFDTNEGFIAIHDEGKSMRFLFALLMWECALFVEIPDVFQTPYQDHPLDLYTEAFYTSRMDQINDRLEELLLLSHDEIYAEVTSRYQQFEGIKAVGCAWTSYSSEDIASIAAGLGGKALSHCFALLAKDYTYWGGGMPDLTLWRTDDEESGQRKFKSKLVEVKSARDNLSERQRAWLMELQSCGVDCEVCKVVEKEPKRKTICGTTNVTLTTIDNVDDKDST